jgi:hypothetical protein
MTLIDDPLPPCVRDGETEEAMLFRTAFTRAVFRVNKYWDRDLRIERASGPTPGGIPLYDLFVVSDGNVEKCHHRAVNFEAREMIAFLNGMAFALS